MMWFTGTKFGKVTWNSIKFCKVSENSIKFGKVSWIACWLRSKSLSLLLKMPGGILPPGNATPAHATLPLCLIPIPHCNTRTLSIGRGLKKSAEPLQTLHLLELTSVQDHVVRRSSLQPLAASLRCCADRCDTRQHNPPLSLRSGTFL